MYIEREHLGKKMTKLDWPKGRSFVPVAIGNIEVHGDLYQDDQLIESGVTFLADDQWINISNKSKSKICKHKNTWFDRTISYSSDGTEDGMHTRCSDCGIALD